MEDWTLDRTTFEIIVDRCIVDSFQFLFLNNVICKICKFLEEYLINVLKNTLRKSIIYFFFCRNSKDYVFEIFDLDSLEFFKGKGRLCSNIHV